jgi:hypothetical protein
MSHILEFVEKRSKKGRKKVGKKVEKIEKSSKIDQKIENLFPSLEWRKTNTSLFLQNRLHETKFLLKKTSSLNI